MHFPWQFRWRLFLLVFFLSQHHLSLVAQQQVPADASLWMPASKANRPLLLVVTDSAQFTSWQERLLVHQDEEDYSLLLLRDTADLGLFCQQLNRVLNEEELNKKRIYFLGALPEVARAKYNILDRRIFADTHWLPSETLPELAELSLIWQKLITKALWTYDVERIETQSRIVERSPRVEGGIGLGLTTTSNMFRTTAEGIPQDMQFLSYTGYRKVYPRWLFNFTLDVGLKFPNPRKLLQDQVFEQIDVFSLINGDEVEVNLDAEITGYASGGMGAGLSYLLSDKGKSKPYVGLDLYFFGGGFFYTEIDTTIIIDGAGGFSGGGFGGDFDLGDRNEDFIPTTYFHLTLCPQLGLYRELGQRWLLDLNAAYLPDPAQLKGEEEYLSFLRFRIGLRYRFIGKRNTRYEYVRIVGAP